VKNGHQVCILHACKFEMIRFYNKKGCSRRLSDQQHLEELGVYDSVTVDSSGNLGSK